MKCPNCGKWNQANLPHCQFCGVELPIEGAYGQRGVPAWQLELEDKVRAKSYIRVDEDGEIENTVDPRDKLAGEMAELKKRKLEGEQKQRQLRQEAARRGMAPSGREVEVERRYLWAHDPVGAIIIEVEVRDPAKRTGAEARAVISPPGVETA